MAALISIGIGSGMKQRNAMIMASASEYSSVSLSDQKLSRGVLQSVMGYIHASLISSEGSNNGQSLIHKV
jgi:hypothetical protein